MRAFELWMWTIAAGSFTFGALINESFRNRIVLGRYSTPYFILICLSSVGFALVAAAAVRRTVGGPADIKETSAAWRTYPALLALAAATWGASLLTQYPIDPYHMRRLFLGEFFGATQAAGIGLEYLAQVFLGMAAVLFLATKALRAEERKALAFARGLLVLSALLGTYLLAEGVVRAVNVTRPQMQGVPTKPSRIWTQRYAALNGQGYRDAEFVKRSDPKELRILVIGDSITYGSGIINAGDRFANILAARLAAAARFHAVGVFNAGIRDTNSFDHLGILQSLIPLEPDLVLLAYVFNDIEHVAPPPRRIHFDASGSYWVRLNPSRLLMLNSHLFDQLLLRYRSLQPSPEEGLGAYGDEDLLRRHVDVLAQIVDTAVAGGASFRLVPFDIAVREGRIYRERYRRLVDACLQRGIPIWQMERLFDTLPYESLIVNTWDHHPNERAHRLVGELLAARILTEGEMTTRRAFVK